MNEKGQIGSLQNIVLVLVGIGILIGIGFLVLEEFESNLSENVATVTNETVTAVTETGKYVEYNYTTAGINCYNSFSPVIVTNASNGVVISSTNYNYDSNGKIWSTTATYNNTNWNVTYTYQYGTEACGGVESTIEATGKVPTWLPLVVILLIVGIVMWLVFRVMPSGGMSIGGVRFGRGGTVAEI